MSKYYCLEIRDEEEDYTFTTLIYTNLKDYEKARKIIEQAEKNYYNDDFENEEFPGGFYEYLETKLQEQGLFTIVKINKIYV